MNPRSLRRGLFVGAGVLLLLIVVFNFVDNPENAERNISSNTIFFIGGIVLIFFNTRK